MNPDVQVALIVVAGVVITGMFGALTGFVGPVVLRRMDRSQRAAERQEDRKDREAVASQAREAAEKLVASNAEVAAAAKETGAQTLAAVGVIHTLVNSNLTEAIEDSLVSAEAALLTMHELASFRPPAPEGLARIATMEDKVASLRIKLADRREQGAMAEAQMAAEAKRAELAE